MDQNLCPICQNERAYKSEEKKVLCTHCGYVAFPLEPENIVIDSAAVKKKRDHKEPFFLIDVRRADERAKAMIQEAHWIPITELPQRWQELPQDKEIIVHCHYGGRSFHAARYLSQKGLKKVKSLDGGIDAWSAYIDPSIPRY